MTDRGKDIRPGHREHLNRPFRVNHRTREDYPSQGLQDMVEQSGFQEFFRHSSATGATLREEPVFLIHSDRDISFPITSDTRIIRV